MKRAFLLLTILAGVLVPPQALAINHLPNEHDISLRDGILSRYSTVRDG